jgi:hypothetical protein
MEWRALAGRSLAFNAAITGLTAQGTAQSGLESDPTVCWVLFFGKDWLAFEGPRFSNFSPPARPIMYVNSESGVFVKTSNELP